MKKTQCSSLMLAALLTVSVSANAGQLTFKTTDAAVQALIDAAAAEGKEKLKAVLGDQLDKLSSGDAVADAADRQAFIDQATKLAAIEEGADGKTATLVLGEADWPFPIPLVKEDKGWRFDTKAGLDEVYHRRIGLNELHAIAVARAYVEAQQEYASVDRDGDGVKEYAQRILSSEGKKDGLYWPNAKGEAESPFGPMVADAVAEGYSKKAKGEGPKPYHGYFYRVLKAQGKNARGGAKGYLKDGNMTEGFALLAYPAIYGNSGLMTFVVNQQGILYDADLGEKTLDKVKGMERFDPGTNWHLVRE